MPAGRHVHHRCCARHRGAATLLPAPTPQLLVHCTEPPRESSPFLPGLPHPRRAEQNGTPSTPSPALLTHPRRFRSLYGLHKICFPTMDHSYRGWTIEQNPLSLPSLPDQADTGAYLQRSAAKCPRHRCSGRSSRFSMLVRPPTATAPMHVHYALRRKLLSAGAVLSLTEYCGDEGLIPIRLRDLGPRRRIRPTQGDWT